MGLCSGKQAPPNPHAIDLTHFELLKVVGKGGFGKVNAITKLTTNELLALKRIEKAAVLVSAAHLRMVWLERKIMSIVDSPFLCHLLHAFENPQEIFLVMPFMQGGDLRFHLKERGTMSEQVGQFYAAEILLGLEELHRRKIVYRDLKPDNILLDEEGHLKISDFGLASILEKSNNYQTTGQAGTRGYQSPEVITDQWYGPEADVWSFGIVVFELLHGMRPFKDWQKLANAGARQVDKLPDLGDGGEGGGKNKGNEGPAEADGPYGVEGRALDDDGLDPQDVRTHIHRMKDFHISSRLSPVTHDFLRRILSVDPKQRLGYTHASFSSNYNASHGWAAVKAHPFFKGIDWLACARKELVPPIKPDTTRANCTADADLADQLLDRKPRDIPDEQQIHFQGWNYRTEVNPANNSSKVNSHPSPSATKTKAPVPPAANSTGNASGTGTASGSGIETGSRASSRANRKSDEFGLNRKGSSSASPSAAPSATATVAPSAAAPVAVPVPAEGTVAPSRSRTSSPSTSPLGAGVPLSGPPATASSTSSGSPSSVSAPAPLHGPLPGPVLAGSTTPTSPKRERHCIDKRTSSRSKLIEVEAKQPITATQNELNSTNNQSSPRQSPIPSNQITRRDIEVGNGSVSTPPIATAISSRARTADHESLSLSNPRY